MQLNAGARLGGYEVIGGLGAGGMGEVYRARDTRLGRDVALKILPETFAQDPERVARFHREAQVLASLNHPHIAAIHGLEESAGARVLVLELVDGETLADRLKRGAMPVDEAIAVARQIAEALGAAHDKGIVHRDLKPANIALSSQDQVKILDFGLARAFEPMGGSDTSNSPTLTLHATQSGVILGTAAYMSPEQAKGRAADKRADIWAFGCVMFEMLTARRAFQGEDVSDTLAAVLRGDPDWNALPATTPLAVRTLIQNCLVKDRAERVGDIAVAHYVLRQPPSRAEPSVPAASRGRRARWAVAAAVSAALATALAVAGWRSRDASVPARTPTRFTIAIPSGQIVSEVVRRRHFLALSPDGTRLAYIADDQIYVRGMDELEAAPLRGSHELPVELTFSPDGQWLAYFAAGSLKKLPVGGGAAVVLAKVSIPYGISWSGDRIFVGEGSSGIVEVPANGGTPKQVVEASGQVLFGPQLLPGGTTLLFTAANSLNDAWSDANIMAQSLTTGRRTMIARGGTDGRYVSTGHLLFGRNNVLFASAFDLTRLELRGGSVGVVERVAVSGGPTGAVHYAFSNNGSLLHWPSTQGVMSTFSWRTRQGVEIPITGAPEHAYDNPRISPDGRRIALHIADQDNDIWIWDVVAQTLNRITFETGLDSFPVWTRDGKRVVYVSASHGDLNLYIRPSDGTGNAVPLLPKPPASNGALVANGITPDGKYLVYSIGTPSNVMMLAIDGSEAPVALLANPQYAERGGQVSPDGKWLAYQSDESGSFQVYVRPFPDVNAGRWQVSSTGGTLPLWAPNGRELYFVDLADHIEAVPVETRTTFSFGRPVAVLDVADRPATVYRNYDVSPDGSKFIVVKEPLRSRAAIQVVVTLDWFEELKRRVPIR